MIKLTRDEAIENCADYQESIWVKELLENQSSASLRKHIIHGLTGMKTLPDTVLVAFLNKYYSPQEFEIENENNLYNI